MRETKFTRCNNPSKITMIPIESQRFLGAFLTQRALDSVTSFSVSSMGRHSVGLTVQKSAATGSVGPIPLCSPNSRDEFVYQQHCCSCCHPRLTRHFGIDNAFSRIACLQKKGILSPRSDDSGHFLGFERHSAIYLPIFCRCPYRTMFPILANTALANESRTIVTSYYLFTYLFIYFQFSK